MSKPTLGYWNIRGLAEPLRLMLAYGGVEYNDERIDFDPFPNFRETWLKQKYEIGVPLPNLPYYIDGDLKVPHVYFFLIF